MLSGGGEEERGKGEGIRKGKKERKGKEWKEKKRKERKEKKENQPVLSENKKKEMGRKEGERKVKYDGWCVLVLD